MTYYFTVVVVLLLAYSYYYIGMTSVHEVLYYNLTENKAYISKHYEVEQRILSLGGKNHHLRSDDLSLSLKKRERKSYAP